MKIESKVLQLKNSHEINNHLIDKEIVINCTLTFLDKICSVIYKIIGYKGEYDEYVKELADSITKMINATLYDNKSPLYCDNEYEIINFIYTSKEIKNIIKKGYFMIKSNDKEEMIYVCAFASSKIKHIIENHFTL
jgi:hypothetical protein